MPLSCLGLAKRFIDLVMQGEEFYALDDIYDVFSGQQKKRLTLLLSGYGCAWGKCTVCGFGKKLAEIHQKYPGLLRLDHGRLRLGLPRIDDVADLVAFYRMAVMLNVKQQPQWLYIYNGGSFLNADEIPLTAQIAIARLVGQHKSLDSLFVESRPEFVSSLSLARLTDGLKGKTLEIGIGLEAITDRVREVLIRKGFSRDDYGRAVGVCKNRGVKVLAYVFLKPLGLTEAESIDEAVRTIKYAFEAGTDEVSLSCAFVQEGTVMYEAFLKEGEEKFIPP
ncbi:MAG: hypothetical protein COY09_02865 [Candidatus Portnoybacteria bacterium CG_4_10_14_0_2_um_filter_39_11]|uniref:Elp3/MiaA/NifB-like radical SAM core domain-containing protein n=1 Tax=Candidatus Portnoybacteria bacterium CG_4_10_14_0_2_um_filter_39_11 TaxID=1974797 RepID=A0A2M7UGX9_9BACT|nr:MAG: hypothetical protein COY09_02865 [Candidatus Portnoybacteria bacterium CG_4_10_14_0_2_um_filter_39_11]